MTSSYNIWSLLDHVSSTQTWSYYRHFQIRSSLSLVTWDSMLPQQVKSGSTLVTSNLRHVWSHLKVQVKSTPKSLRQVEITSGPSKILRSISHCGRKRSNRRKKPMQAQREHASSKQKALASQPVSTQNVYIFYWVEFPNDVAVNKATQK